jgi:hypothetical protein
VTTGVKCKANPRCPNPAPVDSRICFEHRKLIHLAAMRQSPSLSVRLSGHVLTRFADRDIEAGE